MKRLISVISICAVFLFNCQKKQEDPAVDPSTGCTNCSTSTATKYFAILKSGIYTNEDPVTTPTVVNRASAYFSSEAVSIAQLSTMINVGSVFFNGDSLVNSSHPYYYTNTNTISLATESWNVSGGTSIIPSFTYNNVSDKPGYTSMSLLPDSFNVALGFSVTITDISHITAASILISDGQTPTPNTYSRLLNAGNDTLFFYSTNLAALNTGTNGSISLVLENSQVVKIDGKDIKISKEKVYTRRVKIKH